MFHIVVIQTHTSILINLKGNENKIRLYLRIEDHTKLEYEPDLYLTIDIKWLAVIVF